MKTRVVSVLRSENSRSETDQELHILLFMQNISLYLIASCFHPKKLCTDNNVLDEDSKALE